MLSQKLLTISCIGLVSLSTLNLPAQAQSVAQLKAEITKLKSELSVYKMRDNMITLQMVLDLYGSKHKGIFPTSTNTIYSFATSGPQKYFTEIKNPVTNSSWSSRNKYGKGVVQIIGSNVPKTCKSGTLIYQPVKDKKSQVNSFYLYGCDSNGKIMEEFLSNSMMNMDGIPAGGLPAGGRN